MNGKVRTARKKTATLRGNAVIIQMHLFSFPILASNRMPQIQMQRESPAFEPRPKPTPLRHFGSRAFRKIGRVRFFIAV